MTLQGEFARSCVPINIIPDNEVEEEEEFLVVIDSHTDNVILGQQSTTVIIIDSISEYNEVIEYF